MNLLLSYCHSAIPKDNDYPKTLLITNKKIPYQDQSKTKSRALQKLCTAHNLKILFAFFVTIFIIYLCFYLDNAKANDYKKRKNKFFVCAKIHSTIRRRRRRRVVEISKYSQAVSHSVGDVDFQRWYSQNTTNIVLGPTNTIIWLFCVFRAVSVWWLMCVSPLSLVVSCLVVLISHFVSVVVWCAIYYWTVASSLSFLWEVKVQNYDWYKSGLSFYFYSYFVCPWLWI